MRQISATPAASTPAAVAAQPWEASSRMSLFLFRLHGGRQFALTSDPTGRNIPVGFSQEAWAYVRRLDLLPGEVRIGFDTRAAASAVAKDGYALIGCPYDLD